MVATIPHVSRSCIHCGQSTDCPADTQPEELFCCSGCRAAYQLIQGWGLGEFYALREQIEDSPAASVKQASSSYDQFDQQDFLGTSAPMESGNGICSTEFAVRNMHCAACAWLIENVAAHTPGWHSARVNMSDHTLRIVYNKDQVKLSRIASLMGGLGYDLSPIDRSNERHIEQENRRLLVQIAIAGFLAANSMWIAVAMYAGELSWVAAEHHYFLGLIGALLGVWSMFGPGKSFLRGAWASIRTGTPHMDLPISIGLFVGSVVGVVNAVRGIGDIYFDSIAALIFFLLIGRWVQFRQQHRAAKAVDLMLRITPRYANRIDSEGSTEAVLVDNLRPGEAIRVAAGESFAADGTIVRGDSMLDRSLLTGESVPVRVMVGDSVAAGTINISSPVDVEVSAVGKDSRIGQVMRSVELAAAERTPIVQLADRIGMGFVIGITVLGAITFGLWIPTGFGRAATVATSLLIVACPCGLALATPLAIAVGLGRAAKRKILIRDGQSLQRLSQPGRMWLDKTGTLTEGRQVIQTLAGDETGLQLAAAIERECNHPISIAIRNEASRRGFADMRGTLEKVDGGGVSGRIGSRQVLVGNLDFMRLKRVDVRPEFERQMERSLARGESPILVAADGCVITLLGLCDPLRSDAKETIQLLKKQGWRLGVLSGDHPRVVEAIAEQLGLNKQDCFGGLSPEDKLAAIRESRSIGGTVVMVGDGANDAAALAAADVGIAVRGGAEVSLQAAPVYIASGNLRSIYRLVKGALATTRVIYLTFAVSLAYNVLAVALSMSGRVSPLVAALLMPASSASVLTIVIAIQTFGKEKS
jgi:P-type Cu2+ transporter